MVLGPGMEILAQVAEFASHANVKEVLRRIVPKMVNSGNKTYVLGV